uniref:Uncharacterized protein n=1 Tax=Noctiluca scintillans TaxID=2966 RepID=A0A7S1B1J6_NOCSC|mmetsp:Transcript_8990/g.25081  ORF Transcript_8990/g.25081 Transcript_8990/m.25081 type:complete len:183 (+) Transcript_8990:28-576(+)
MSIDSGSVMGHSLDLRLMCNLAAAVAWATVTGSRWDLECEHVSESPSELSGNVPYHSHRVAERGCHASTDIVLKRPQRNEMKFDELGLKASEKPLAEMQRQATTDLKLAESIFAEDTTKTVTVDGLKMRDQKQDEVGDGGTLDSLDTREDKSKLVELSQGWQASDDDDGMLASLETREDEPL